ncbi:MAG: tyrosine-type recombinase/integrase [Proteobacteria bacterium]|nr:tyrosine-type recombinase/integrase [Pseudomonadota bacterium]
MKQRQYLAYYVRLFLVQFLPNGKGLRENSILACRDALKLLLKFRSDHLKIGIGKAPCDRIDDSVVREFPDWLERERSCAPGTRSARLAALKTFFRYLGRGAPECLDNTRKISAIPLKKVPRKTVEYLDTDELKAILDSVDVSSLDGFRGKAPLLFMRNTGAGVQEVADVKLEDLRFDAASQVKPTGKGDKQRVCPLWRETIEAVEAYPAERNPKRENEEYLFLNAKGESITRFGIGYIVKKYTGKASEKQPSLKRKNVSPHTFRHTAAMHLPQSGNEPNPIRLRLGHASPNTTHMYIGIDMKLKREILSKTQPPNLKREEKKWRKPKVLEWLDGLLEGAELCEV